MVLLMDSKNTYRIVETIQRYFVSSLLFHLELILYKIVATGSGLGIHGLTFSTLKLPCNSCKYTYIPNHTKQNNTCNIYITIHYKHTNIHTCKHTCHSFIHSFFLSFFDLILSFHFVSFRFISFHCISVHSFISFHFTSFHFISFHSISFHFISLHSINTFTLQYITLQYSTVQYTTEQYTTVQYIHPLHSSITLID